MSSQITWQDYDVTLEETVIYTVVVAAPDREAAKETAGEAWAQSEDPTADFKGCGKGVEVIEVHEVEPVPSKIVVSLDTLALEERVYKRACKQLAGCKMPYVIDNLSNWSENDLHTMQIAAVARGWPSVVLSTGNELARRSAHR